VRASDRLQRRDDFRHEPPRADEPSGRNPSPFPCQVEGCDAHADGWIDVDTWKQFGRDVPDGAGGKVWACKPHLHVEVAEVTYDTERISYQELLDVFWQLHDPTSLDDQGPYERGTQYRAVIVYHDAEQATLAAASKAAREAAGVYAAPIETEIRAATTFWPAEDFTSSTSPKVGNTIVMCLRARSRFPRRKRPNSRPAAAKPARAFGERRFAAEAPKSLDGSEAICRTVCLWS
jgi:hypothetical protein